MSKKIKISVLVFFIVAIVALATYAWILWNSPNNTELTMQIGNLAEIKFTNGNNISTANAGPVLNPDVDGEITTFSVLNKSTNAYDLRIYLNVTAIDAASKTEGFKYKLLSSTSENGTYTSIKEDNFVNITTGENTIYETTLPANTTQYYKFIVYIDGTVSNNDNLQGKTFTATLNASATHKEAPVNLDNSGANVPELVDGLIPIMYDGSNWVKADSANSNSTYQWYDYDTAMWANAVLVSSTNRETYKSSSLGTTIPESDILAYYVWIPRYKYKVFNINKVIGTDSYSARTTGIDIVFETGTSSTGTVSCTNYSFATPTSSTLNETCSGSNGDYYTHPAFNFGGSDVKGIWVAKFELSSSNPSINVQGGGSSTTLTARSKPGIATWRNNTLGSFHLVIRNMQKTNNEYGLSTDSTVLDTHIIKNIEWGAVAYLTNSKYGKCVGGTCSEIGINNYWSNGGITGCGAATNTNSSTTCNAYNTENGLKASTTGNIYGIYDMSGGLFEYVMANMSSTADSYTYNAGSAGSDYSYTVGSTDKYINTYANYSSGNDQASYNRAILGDATGEVVASSGTAWYSDTATFITSSSEPWMRRGGYYSNTTQAGIFRFNTKSGGADGAYTTRMILVIF